MIPFAPFNCRSDVPDPTMPDYSKLPPEILIKVFRHLSFYDIQAVRLCCKQFFYVTKLPELDLKGVVKIMSCPLDDNHPAAEVILGIQIEKLYLKGVQFGKVDNLFQHIGTSLKELTLKLVPITVALRLTFAYFPNLHTLKVCQVKIATLVEDVQLPKVGNLTELKELVLIGNESSVNKLLLHYCTIHTKNMKSLTIEFTRKDEEELLSFLKKHSPTLIRADLHFYQNLQLESSKWVRVFRNMNLEELGLQGNFCNDIVIRATTAQMSLRSLDISGSVAIDDEYLALIGNNFLNLERLILAYSARITDPGLKHLAKLTKLKILDITSCNNLTSVGVRNFFGRTPNCNLLELHLPELSLDADLICFCANNLPNLRVFNLSGCCANSLTNKAIQEIFDCQRQLRELRVDNCFRVTDAGILGYETGNSIQYLKNLERLSLRGCKQISDITLSSGLRLPQLKFLDISYCGKVTNNGLQAMTQLCPAIEEICLTFGKSMDHLTVQTLIKGLGRLRLITINNCTDPLQFRGHNWNVYRVCKVMHEVTLKKYPRPP